MNFFDNIPGHWKILKMGDVVEFQQGLQIAKSERYPNQVAESLPILKIGDMINGIFTEFFKNPNPKYITSKDDIIVTRTGQVGLIFSDIIGVLHNNCFKIVFDKKNV